MNPADKLPPPRLTINEMPDEVLLSIVRHDDKIKALAVSGQIATELFDRLDKRVKSLETNVAYHEKARVQCEVELAGILIRLERIEAHFKNAETPPTHNLSDLPPIAATNPGDTVFYKAVREAAKTFSSPGDGITYTKIHDIRSAGYAVATLKAFMQDHGYAWSWHCHIAMTVKDMGIPECCHTVCNAIAKRLMKALFDAEGYEPQRAPQAKTCLTQPEIEQRDGDIEAGFRAQRGEPKPCRPPDNTRYRVWQNDNGAHSKTRFCNDDINDSVKVAADLNNSGKPGVNYYVQAETSTQTQDSCIRGSAEERA